MNLVATLKNTRLVKSLAALVAAAVFASPSVVLGQAGECLAGGCNNSSQFPSGTQSTTSTAFVVVTTCIFAGEFSKYNVISGTTYEWSLCSADTGATPSYDATLTLAADATPGTPICFSDDICGNQPKIRWTATFTGVVRVNVNTFSPTCGTNSTCTTIAWHVVAAAPANDACAAATLITCPSATAGTTVAATLDGGLPSCASVAPSIGNHGGNVSVTAPGVWYRIVGTGGTVTVDTLTASYDTKLHVFTGTCGNLTCVTANDDINAAFRSKVAFQTVAGQDYFILVNGFGTGVGTFTLNVTCAATPANDNCGSATIIGPSNGSVTGTTVGATGPGFTANSSSLASCASNATDPLFDVWYSYTAPCNGNLAINTCGAFDTLLSVHSACPTLALGNQLTPTGSTCNNNGPAGCTPGSQLTAVPVLSGVTYLIRVAGAVGAAAGGSFTVTWSINDVAPPIFSNCPPNVTVGTTIGCSAIVMWPPPTAMDNCSIPTVVSTHNPGDTFPKGTTIVTYTATDFKGQTATCAFTVTVVDDDPPSINCPGNIIVGTDPGLCGNNTAAFPLPFISDNCPNDQSVDQISGPEPGDFLVKGVHTIVYQATDRGGNTATCSFTITVVDDEPPSITCPANITTGVDTGECFATVSWDDAVASDNCPNDLSVVQTAGPASGSQINAGVVTIVYQATDRGGNTTTCSFTVTVIEDEPPTITCPANQTVQCLSDIPAPDASLPTTTDNCSDVTVTHLSTVQLPGGTGCQMSPFTVVRTYQACDENNNCSTCTQTFTVFDITPPVTTIVGQQVVSVQCLTEIPSANPAGYFSAQDNCGGFVSLTFVEDQKQPGGQGCLGNPTIVFRVYKATDTCGNFATVTQTFVIADITPPVAVSSGPIAACFPDAAAAEAAAKAHSTATDNCTPVGSLVETASTVGTCSATIMVTFADFCGNLSNTLAYTTRIDNTAPAFIGAPADATVECSAIPAAAVVTAVDNCDGPVPVSFAQTLAAGSCDDSFTITRTWSATDSCGNIGTHVQVLTVVDTTPPVLSSLPADATVECDAIPAAAVLTATDNCDDSVPVSFDEETDEGKCANESTITRTWIAVDDCGNQTVHVQVLSVVDTTEPVLAGVPADITIECNDPVPAPANVTATDNCDKDVPVTFSQTTQPGLCPAESVITRTWTAVDDCGNQVVESQTITIDDSTGPTILVCPADLEIAEIVDGGGQTGFAETPNFIPLTFATDNCSDAGDLVKVQVPAAGTLIPIGITKVSVFITDECGNQSECSINVDVKPNTGGTLILDPDGDSDCVQPGESVFIEVRMEDLGLFPAAGFQAFLEFSTSLQWVATTYTAAPFGQVILPGTPVGNTLDLATGIIPNVQPTTNADSLLATLEFVALTEDCDGFVRFRPHVPPSRITDAVGTEALPITLVNADPVVIDGTDPIFVTPCPLSMTLVPPPGSCDVVVSWDPPTFTDNCADAPLTVVSSHDPGDTFSTGTTTVTYTATDCAGNSVSCSFDITVTDYNEVAVDVELSPTVAASLSRCIRFEFWDCISATPVAVVNEVVSFSGGSASVVLQVPCGEAYSCVTARDRLHTLRRTASLGVSGNQYTANFTGADQLRGGNLNDDLFIDILDFGVFTSQFSFSLAANTTCATLAPHSDISGDGTVNLGDFSFIQVNFLLFSESNCCGALGIQQAPVVRISVGELNARGLGSLASGDLNQDGWLDEADVAALLGGVMPTPVVQSTAGGSWFDTAAWGGVMPTSQTDVLIGSGMILDQPGAVARDITVVSGGSLTITTGSLQAHNVEVQAGATLILDHAATMFNVNALTIEQGAVLVWNDGSVEVATVLVNAGMLTASGEISTLHVNGDYIQTLTGTLLVRVAGLEPGVGHDQLVVSGMASLDGQIVVSLMDEFLPQPGDSFSLFAAGLIDGFFTSSQLPALDQGQSFDLGQGDIAVTITVVNPSAVIGDLDGNGLVDGIDLGMVLASFGQCTPCTADLNGDGQVDGVDLGIVLANWPQE